TSTSLANVNSTREHEKRQSLVSTGDDQVHRLRPLAFLVGLNIERDALPLVQRLQPSALNSGDMHEYVPPAVIRLDETISAIAVEEFDLPGHCHRETSYPRGCSAAVPPRHDSSAGHSHPGESVGPKQASVTPAASRTEAERQSQPDSN